MTDLDESLLSEREQLKYERKLEKASIERERRIKENEIYEIEADVPILKKRKFETSKFLMYLILINCVFVEVYSMWVMYYLKDLSALYSLIGAVITSSITFAIYCAKAYKGKKSQVDAQLERDMFEASLINDACDDEPEDIEGDDSEDVSE